MEYNGRNVRCSWDTSAHLGESLASLVQELVSVVSPGQPPWDAATTPHKNPHAKKQMVYKRGSRNVCCNVHACAPAPGSSLAGKERVVAVVAPGNRASTHVLAELMPAADAWREGRTLWIWNRSDQVHKSSSSSSSSINSSKAWSSYSVKLNKPRVLKMSPPQWVGAGAPVVVTVDVLHSDPARSQWRWWADLKEDVAVDQHSANVATVKKGARGNEQQQQQQQHQHQHQQQYCSKGFSLAFTPPRHLKGQTIICECTPVSIGGNVCGVRDKFLISPSFFC